MGTSCGQAVLIKPIANKSEILRTIFFIAPDFQVYKMNSMPKYTKKAAFMKTGPLRRKLNHQEENNSFTCLKEIAPQFIIAS
jgi:hypothetical protein